MISDTETRSHRDSWPPTQIRLAPDSSLKSVPPAFDLDQDIDENPLTYFLTPIPGIEGDGEEDENDNDIIGSMDMFDAGIEDPKNSKGIIRSVSPSNLYGLGKPANRPLSPDFDSDAPTTDDDDGEEYIHFSPGSPSFLDSSDFSIDGNRNRGPYSPPSFARSTSPYHKPLTPSLAMSPRGRARFNGQGGRLTSSRSGSSTAWTRPRQLWRQPSPDVWSIEEETEDDAMASGAITPLSLGTEEPPSRALPVKPKKKVRFLLPVQTAVTA